MPSLQIRLVPALEVALRQGISLDIRTDDDHGDSIFTDAETLLKERRFQRGLKALPQHTAGNYRSILDWLFCQLQPSFAEACQAYYDDQGPRLADDPRATAANVALWDRQLRALLHAAAVAASAKEVLEWDFVRLYAEHEAAGPPALN